MKGGEIIENDKKTYNRNNFTTTNCNHYIGAESLYKKI